MYLKIDTEVERFELVFDGWMDGWMDGRMDGWMDGWMNCCREWMHGKTAGTNRWLELRLKFEHDNLIPHSIRKRQTDRQTD